MKYVVLIADGAADKPLAELAEAAGVSGHASVGVARTPFEAARMPRLQALAQDARSMIGTAVTTPPGFGAGSDVCSMSLLGYDPARYHTGRAPLEAAALGIPLGASDWIFRVNLVTVGAPGSGADAGLMLDHSAGAITDAEARVLVRDLLAHWQREMPELNAVGSDGHPMLRLVPGVSYRNIMVDGSGGGGEQSGSSDDKFDRARDYAHITTTPPHEIPRQPFAEHLPRAATASAPAENAAAFLRRLIELSAPVLSQHGVNADRAARGLRPANLAWIWGQGTRPAMPSFRERFGLRGAMITSVDLLAGIAALMGWDRLEVPGLTSYHDTDYAAQGRATCEAIGCYDIVCCHVESPDEASHQGDWKTKLAAIEAIDELVLALIVERLRKEETRAGGGWRLLYLPDHYTLVSTRKHDATPVPFLIAGSSPVRGESANAGDLTSRRYHERTADASDVQVKPGHTLMELFLGVEAASQVRGG